MHKSAFRLMFFAALLAAPAGAMTTPVRPPIPTPGCGEVLTGSSLREELPQLRAAYARFFHVLTEIIDTGEQRLLVTFRQKENDLTRALMDLFTAAGPAHFKVSETTGRSLDQELRRIARGIHDWRGQLTVLSNHVKQLHRQAVAHPAPDGKWEDIEHQVHNILVTYFDLGKMLQVLEDPSQALLLQTQEEFPIAALLAEVADAFSGPQGKKGQAMVTVQKVAEGNKLRAFGNPTALRAALMNLVRNSIEAIDSTNFAGVVVVFAERSTLNPAELVLTVQDDGPGMPLGLIEKVMASQGPQEGISTKGTQGVGLANVRTTIEGQGGYFRLAAPSSGGTTASITLPTAENAVHRAVAPEKRKDLEVQPGSIFVIDDRQDNRVGLVTALELSGYPAFEFEQPDAALSIVAANRGKVGMVLLDMTGLLDEDGERTSWLVVAAKLAALDPSVPILLISGWGEPEEKLPANVVGYYPKSYPTEGLVELINQFRVPPTATP